MKEIKYIFFISSSGYDFSTSYGSGSASQKVMARFLRFRFHNTAFYNTGTCDRRKRGGMHEAGRRHRHVHNRTRPRRAATAGLKQRRRRPSRRTTHRRRPPPFRLFITMPPRRRSRARRRTSSPLLHRRCRRRRDVVPLIGRECR
jgi:hypothetical protein